MITIKDVVKYILKNRKGKVCVDWSIWQICDRLKKAVDDELFFYTSDNENNITGIVWCSINKQNTLYVEALLTTDSSSLKQFIGVLKIRFKSYELCAHRHCKFVTYNTHNLISKFYGRNNTNRCK